MLNQVQHDNLMWVKNKSTVLLFFIILLYAGFFGFSGEGFAESKVIINEVQIEGAAKNDDFIELYNASCDSVDLSGWRLKKRTGNGSESSIGSLKNSIPPKGYFLWANIGGGVFINPDYSTKTYYLSENYSLGLFNANDELTDALTWGTNLAPFSGSFIFSGNPGKNQSLLRDNDSFYLNNGPSPQNSSYANDGELASCKPKEYSNKIYLNEILPNAEEEFVELYNPTEKDEDLSGWILRDASKTGKYTFPDNTLIKSTGYWVVYKKDFKFALNNSGEEAVYLYNPDEILISQVAYNSAKENVSFNFNGASWRWSKFLTPGKENIFNNLPQSKTKKDKKIYVGVPAEFSAKTSDKDRDNLKYTWDFGDGHKSYKKNTKHAFEKSGKYNVVLKINDGSEEKMENFKIKVEKFPKTKIKITTVVPNPKGKDSDFEYLTVENKSKKKTNLKDWIVATGSKKLYNHPISEDLIIKPGEKINLTRQFSKFSLNNKKAKIELRYPNGKTAHKIKYSLQKSAQEDERYEKTQLGWVWIKKNIQKKIEGKTMEFTSNFLENKAENKTVVQTAESLKPGGQSVIAERKDFNQKIILALAKYKSEKIEKYLPTQNAKKLSLKNNQYIFADYYVPQKHYAVAWWENTLKDINLLFNKLFH